MHNGLNQLLDSIHVESLSHLCEYWIDKNYVYCEYLTSDGISIYRLDTADRKTFESFGRTKYARDKDFVHTSRHGIIAHVDIETFKPISIDSSTGHTVYARDKNNYYFWNILVEDSLELNLKK